MVPSLLTLDDLPAAALDGLPVLVRVDFNLPFQGDRITDRSRLTAALPTLRELRDSGARLVLASHRGRPRGAARPELSLAPIVPVLMQELAAPVTFAADCVGNTARAAVAALGPGGVCLLENLRFHAGEEANDPDFAARLSELAAVWVTDAFGTVHRAHASTAGIAGLVAHRAAGRLVELEVAQLGRLLSSPQRPYVGILGGAKISGKLDTLRRLIESLDVLLVGGGMANTFLAAQGHELGRSLVETELLGVAREVLARAAERGVEIVLPSDLVVTDDLESDLESGASAPSVVRASAVPASQLAADIGPASVLEFTRRIADARTLFWNGPLGVFERPPFDRASLEVARAVAACPGFTVIGGGETGAVLVAAGVESRINHVSTGGGASLELLAGKSLPGLEAVAGS